VTEQKGRWHGSRFVFGYHHDLHVDTRDTGIGTRCAEEELVPALRLTGADFVQTDSKGHPGYTSWFSRTPNASIGPGVEKDALAAWRSATRRLKLPLHAHYSGIWDKAAGEKHPEWCIITADGTPARAAWGGIDTDGGDKMCPRGGYVLKLMIPQLLEMASTHGIDGVWIDGDIWAMQPCYCERCRAAFREKTGARDPPRERSDPGWAAWWNFTRESFEEYVATYTEALHREAPNLLVCSNWLQTFRHPGPPEIPTDWISGDNTASWGMDSGRCEARFISTRGKPWDIMMWDFCFPRGWLGDPDWAPTVKPVQMLQQEAAVTVSLGGNVQVCDNPFAGLREGQLVPWRLRRVSEVARFVKRRRSLCQGTRTIPQIAVLHSEAQARSAPIGLSPRDIDTAPVQGAVFSLLECSWGVDVLDEWALLPRLPDFPVVVAPEQDAMSPAMVSGLKAYAENGGRLLVSGAGAPPVFGQDFLGVKLSSTTDGAVYHVPASGAAVAAWSARWAFAEPVSARPLGRLGATPSLTEKLLPWPAAFVNTVGRGTVAWVPFNVFRDFERNRYPLLREFIRAAVRPLARDQDIEVKAPACVDVVLRRKGRRRIIHLVNRSTGIPTLPNSGVIDEVAPVGPVQITVRQAGAPPRITSAFEEAGITVARRAKGQPIRLTVAKVHIHAAVVLEESP
jgi:hypothetical protein